MLKNIHIGQEFYTDNRYGLQGPFLVTDIKKKVFKLNDHFRKSYMITTGQEFGTGGTWGYGTRAKRATPALFQRKLEQEITKDLNAEVKFISDEFEKNKSYKFLSLQQKIDLKIELRKTSEILFSKYAAPRNWKGE